MKALFRDMDEGLGKDFGIYEVRKLEGKELDGLADWYKPIAYAGHETQALPNITWNDQPKTKSDGSLPGSNNCIWLLPENELNAFVKLDADRAAEVAARKQAKAQAAATARQQIFDKAKATGEKQLLRSYVSNDCLDNLPDCSFDNVYIWAMPDGTEKKTHSHCF